MAVAVAVAAVAVAVDVENAGKPAFVVLPTTDRNLNGCSQTAAPILFNEMFRGRTESDTPRAESLEMKDSGMGVLTHVPRCDDSPDTFLYIRSRSSTIHEFIFQRQYMSGM